MNKKGKPYDQDKYQSKS